eukprot:1160087-Pelagomonas_calceolata.AAC.3
MMLQSHSPDLCTGKTQSFKHDSKKENRIICAQRDISAEPPKRDSKEGNKKCCAQLGCKGLNHDSDEGNRSILCTGETLNMAGRKVKKT